MQKQCSKTGQMMMKFAVLTLLEAAAAWGAPVMPYGTYLVKGAFKGEYNTVLRDFGTGSVRAQRADGTVIAEATVADADPEGFNFVLSIPVASQATPKACEVGETLDCVFADESESVKVPNTLTVGPPIHVGVLTFNCTPVATCTNAADGSVVEIPTAYLAEAQAYLDAEGEIGKKMDFLIQEMNREANTIGSKASDAEITRCVVELKSEIEKLREQVQNVE